MNKREYRRFTADQNIEILREADQPGVTVSEVCRRHGLSPSVLYRWRAVAQGGSAVALKRDAQRAPLWVFLQGVLFGLKDALKEKYALPRMAIGMRAPKYWSW
jgi:transposase-like protein